VRPSPRRPAAAAQRASRSAFAQSRRTSHGALRSGFASAVPQPAQAALLHKPKQSRCGYSAATPRQRHLALQLTRHGGRDLAAASGFTGLEPATLAAPCSAGPPHRQ
jgi:hypothetical protein